MPVALLTALALTAFGVAYTIALVYFWKASLRTARVFCRPTYARLAGMSFVTAVAIATIFSVLYTTLMKDFYFAKKGGGVLIGANSFLFFALLFSLVVQQHSGMTPMRGCRHDPSQ